MEKTVFLRFFVVAIGMAAFADPVSCTRASWEGNPIAWTFDAASGSIRARGLSDIAVLKDACASKVTVSAQVVPAPSGTNDWLTLGVAIVDDSRNFWHLALVQAPLNDKWNPGDRYFELCEMKNGEWLSQSVDMLKRTEFRKAGGWNYGETYSLTLASDSAGIRGEVKDAAGKVIFACRYAFPAAGSAVTAVTCGRAGLRATKGFQGVFSKIDATSAEPHPPADTKANFPSYTSDSFIAGVTDKATGFFHVVQREDGRWWTIDPLGRGVVLLGVDHVRYAGHLSQRTRRNVHLEANRRKFPNKADWASDALARLKSWGFNLLGAGCELTLRHRGLVHTAFLSMGNALCGSTLPAEYYICPNEHRPCSAFPNVFHPDFEAWCDHVARTQCRPVRDDPWLFGYFLDNELAWWGRGALDTGLFDAVAKLPDGHPARKAQKDFLSKRGVKGAVSKEVKLDFLRLAAERYFGIASAAIRRHDPNHLVMGVRFAGIGGAHPVVWEVAGRYCDVVTFNCYPWADLDRNVMMMSRARNAKRVDAAFAELYGLVKKPMLITEWSFPALDSGLPCTGGAGQRFRTQTLRTQATELFAKTMLSLPFLIGYDYFMWVDQPLEGISDAFPEDSNYGLINLQGDAYPELTAMFMRLHGDVGRWRTAAVPPAREVPSERIITADEAVVRLGATKAAVYHREGDRYVVTGGNLVLEGRVGGDWIFSSEKVDGKDLGRFSMMLCNQADGQLTWHRLDKVTEARWQDGALVVTGVGNSRGTKFSLTCAIRLVADRPWFVCDLVKAVNLGPGRIDVKAFYFNHFVGYATDKDAGSVFKRVPNLWKAIDADAWFRAADGAYLGGATFAPTVEQIRYFTSNNGRGQHPDAMFAPPAPLLMAPNGTYEPRGTIWFISIGAAGGGRAAWKKELEVLESQR